MDYRKIQERVNSLGKNWIPFSVTEYINQIFKAFSKGTMGIRFRPSWVFKYNESLSNKVPYGCIYTSTCGIDINSKKPVAVYAENRSDIYKGSVVWLDLNECEELVTYLNENKEKLNSWYCSELNCRLLERIREIYPDGDEFETTMIDNNKIRMTGFRSIKSSDLTHLIDHINSMVEPIKCTNITIKNWYKGGIQLIIEFDRLR